jgi:hypothetical protein
MTVSKGFAVGLIAFVVGTVSSGTAVLVLFVGFVLSTRAS